MANQSYKLPMERTVATICARIHTTVDAVTELAEAVNQSLGEIDEALDAQPKTYVSATQPDTLTAADEWLKEVE